MTSAEVIAIADATTTLVIAAALALHYNKDYWDKCNANTDQGHWSPGGPMTRRWTRGIDPQRPSDRLSSAAVCTGAEDAAEYTVVRLRTAVSDEELAVTSHPKLELNTSAAL